MKQIITTIQNRLSEIAALQYIDSDWGQLDYYSPNFPVKWPCALIDINRANFSNIGIDKQAEPINRQEGEAVVSITLAKLRLTNSSELAPQHQKDDVNSIWDIVEQVHKILQGFSPGDHTGKLIRTGLNRLKRDDGVQQYMITYSLGLHNV